MLHRTQRGILRLDHGPILSTLLPFHFGFMRRIDLQKDTMKQIARMLFCCAADSWQNGQRSLSHSLSDFAEPKNVSAGAEEARVETVVEDGRRIGVEPRHPWKPA